MTVECRSHLSRKVPQTLFESSPFSLQPHIWDTESQRGRLPWVPRALPPAAALIQPLSAGVTVHVCNEHRYGYMNVPVKSHQGLEDERVNFVHLILEALGEGWEPGACHPCAPFLGPGPDWAVGMGSPPHL